MARNIDAIQADITRTREQLASTLDEIVERTQPSALANEAKSRVSAVLNDPKVRAVAAGVGVVVFGMIALSLRSRAKHARELREIQRLLATAR